LLRSYLLKSPPPNRPTFQGPLFSSLLGHANDFFSAFFPDVFFRVPVGGLWPLPRKNFFFVSHSFPFLASEIPPPRQPSGPPALVGTPLLIFTGVPIPFFFFQSWARRLPYRNARLQTTHLGPWKLRVRSPFTYCTNPVPLTFTSFLLQSLEWSFTFYECSRRHPFFATPGYNQEHPFAVSFCLHPPSFFYRSINVDFFNTAFPRSVFPPPPTHPRLQ